MTPALLPPRPVYSLFSGGKDSFACASVLSDAGLLRGCIIIDTGIAADTWLEDVTNLCVRQAWPYTIIPTTYRYEWFVWRYGFPGPGMHAEIMNYLKGRAIREFKKDHKGEALASGVRVDESDRRTFNAKLESLFEEVTVYAPIMNWRTDEVWAFINPRGYQKPRTYYTLGISGDCLCGAFAMPHERDAIAEHYPQANARLCKLEATRGEQCGKRAVDKILKIRGRKLSREEQAVLCFDCKRQEIPA